MRVKVVDDVPEAVDDCINVEIDGRAKYNLVLTIDTSGSMGNEVGNTGKSRLELIQEAITKLGGLLDQYENIGTDIKVTVINFFGDSDSQNSDDANTSIEFNNLQDAKDYVNNLNSNGFTNYRAALQSLTTTVNQDAADSNLDDYTDIVYFFSDGEPFPSSNELNNTEEQNWRDLIELNDVNAVMVNIAGSNQQNVSDNLAPLANPSDSPSVIEVESDLSNLDELLQETVEPPAPAIGNVKDNDISGADKPANVTEIRLTLADAQEANNYITNNPQLTGATANGVTVIIPIPNATIETPLGGTLEVATDGSYTYTPPAANNIPDTVDREIFEYQLTDDDGDTSVAELAFKFDINRSPDPEDDGVDPNGLQYQVFESGLPTGSDSELGLTPQATMVNGNVLANDDLGDEPTMITQVMFDGNTYTPDGNGVITVNTGLGSYLLYTQDFDGNLAGDFKYTLNSEADHPDGNGNNELFQDFKYTLEDVDGDKGNATVRVKVIDDIPVAEDDCFETTPGVQSKYNLILTIDTSGSMGEEIGNTNKTRLELIQEAITKVGGLLDQYDNLGADVKVTIINFFGDSDSQDSDDANTSIEFNNLQDAKDYVNGLNADGWTNYRAALQKLTAAINQDEADSNLDDHTDIVYFFSDGEPRPSNNELTSNEEQDWRDLIEMNDVNAVMVNIAGDSQQEVSENLAPLANPSDSPKVIEVESDLSNLDELLQETVNPPQPVSGNVLDNDVIGADKPGSVTQVQFTLASNNEAQNYLDDNSQLSGATRNGATIFVPIPNDAIPSPLGGSLVLNADGTFTYTPPNDAPDNGQEAFVYTMQDDDGDTSTAELAFKFPDLPDNLEPEANPDCVNVEVCITPTPVKTVHTITFNDLVKGEIINDQYLASDGVRIETNNFTTSRDFGVVFDTNARNTPDRDLEDTWEGGNLENEELGNIMVIQEGDTKPKDKNNDGIIDQEPNDESGRSAGDITFKFDDPIHSFGFDVIDFEHGVEYNNSKVTFRDSNNQSITLTLPQFAALSASTGLEFIDNSANRFNAVKLEDIEQFAHKSLGDVKEVEIELGGSGGIDNITWETMESDHECPPHYIEGNVMANDLPGDDPTAVQSFRYFDKNGNFVEGVVGQTVTTKEGGEFTLESSGKYTYNQDDGSKEFTELVEYTIVDVNGDPDSSILQIKTENNNVDFYELHNHPDGNQAGPFYGLRLDELFDIRDHTLDVFTMNFDTDNAGMYLEHDKDAGTMRIFGLAFGGLDDGTTQNQSNNYDDTTDTSGYNSNLFEPGLWKIDVTYGNVGAATSNDADGDDFQAHANGGLIGTITRLDTNETFELYAKSNGEFSFQFGDEDGDGHRGADGLSGWGWMTVDGSPNSKSSSQEGTKDFLFTAELICDENKDVMAQYSEFEQSEWVNHPGSLVTLLGTMGDDIMSTAHVNADVIIMEAGTGFDELIIDVSDATTPEVIVIKDIGINKENALKFINADDLDQNGATTLEDVVESFTQDQNTGDIQMNLHNHTTLILQNAGTVQGDDIQALQDHLTNITSNLEVIQ